MNVASSMALSFDAAERVTRRGHNPGDIVIVLPGLQAGGTERIVSFIANRWAAQGRTVTVVTLAHADAGSYYAYDPRVQIRWLGRPPARRGLGSAVAATFDRVRLLREALREIRPVVTISFLTRMNVLTLLAAAGTGIPVVVSERNNPRIQPLGRFWSLLRTSLYPRAFGLVTMTSGAMQAFPAYLRRRSWVIPNPANVPGGRAAPRVGRQLVAVGRLVDQKGFDLLLDAFARVAWRHPDWRLCIWGEGPDRKALESQRDRLGLADRVTLPGVTASPGGWIVEADAFVLSSRYEGWGIVLLEAMAAGLPCVSFACDYGPAEMITPDVDGLLAAAGDVGQLAAALDRLLGDAALRDRLASTAATSALRFAPEAVGEAWDRVVAEAASAEQQIRARGAA